MLLARQGKVGLFLPFTKTYMSLDGLSNLPLRQRKKNEVLRLHFVLVAGEGFEPATFGL